MTAPMNMKVDSLLHSLAQNLDALDKLMRAKVSGDGDVNGWGKFLSSDEPLYQRLDNRYVSGSLSREELFELTSILLREVEFLRNEVVNHLSGMSRLDSITHRPVDMTNLIEDVVNLFQFKAAQKNITIKAECRELPTVMGDASLIRRLLVNLMDNAVKYSYSGTPGGAPRHIDLRAKRHSAQGDFFLELESFGVGIIPEEITSGALFEYGRRGVLAADRHRRGTGIGLAEAKRIVDVHGGRIVLSSTPQDGGAFLTTVFVWLPSGGR